jgi:hypothetical protein
MLVPETLPEPVAARTVDEPVAFDAGDGAVQRAVGFVVLEEEDRGTRRWPASLS